MANIDVDLNQRERLFAALLRGENNSEAARSSGYSRKHVKELVRQPAFIAELARRQEAQDRLAPRQVDPDEDLALEHLRAIVADEAQSGAARVAAAKELRAAARDRRAPRVPTTASRTSGPEGERATTPARSVADEAAAFGIRIAK